MPQKTMLQMASSSAVSCVCPLSLSLFILSVPLPAGFPALFFVPAGPHAQPIPYFKQERELHDLVAFVDAHRTSEPSHHKDEL